MVKPLFTLEELADKSKPVKKVSDVKPLFSLEELVESNSGPEDSYADIFRKAPSRFTPIAKESYGGLLQAIGEQPKKQYMELQKLREENPEGFMANLSNAVKMAGRGAGLAGSLIPYGWAQAFNGEGQVEDTGRKLAEEGRESLNNPDIAYNLQGQGLTGKKVLSSALDALGQMAPGIAASVLTANPAPALAQAFGQGFGSSYGEQRAAGQDEDQALGAAAISGGAEVLFERIPVGVLLKSGNSVLGKIAKSAVAEGLTEVPTQVVQDIVKLKTIEPEMSIDDIWENAKLAGAVGGLVGGSLGGITAPFTREPKKEQLPDAPQELSPESASEAKASDAKPLFTLDELMSVEKPANLKEHDSNVKETSVPHEMQRDHIVEIAPVEDIQQGEDNVNNYVPEISETEIVKPAKEEIVLQEPAQENAVEGFKQNRTPVKEIKPHKQEEIIAHELTPEEFIEAKRPEMPQLVEMSLKEYAESKGVSNLPTAKVRQTYQRILQEGPRHGRDKYILSKNKEAIEQYNKIASEYNADIASGKLSNKMPVNTELRLRREHRAAVEEALASDRGVPNHVVEHYADLKNLTPLMEPKLKDKLLNAKEDVQTAVKTINPKANVEFVDKLFGQGPALIESGAPNTRKREVAGKFDRLQNLITISENQSPKDIKSVAYHEAYHSLEDILAPEERTILEKAYPKKGKQTSSERQAEAFARYMGKSRAVVAPNIKKAFNKVSALISDIGKVLRNNDIKKAEQLFESISKGEIGTRKLEGKEIATLVKDNDINLIKDAGVAKAISSEAIDQASVDLNAPALKQILDTKLSGEDIAGLSEVIAEETGKPEDIAFALRNKTQLGLETVENITTKAIQILESGMTEKKAKALMDEVEQTFKIFTNDSKKGNVKDSLRHFWNLALKTNDGYLRALADTKNSKAVSKVANMFYSNLGKGEGNSRNYYEEQSIFVNTNLFKLSKLTEGLSENDLLELTPILQGFKKAPEGSLVEERAPLFRKLLDDMGDYARSSGINLGEVKDYVRRIYDNGRILSDKAGFIEKATKGYILKYTQENQVIKEQIRDLKKKENGARTTEAGRIKEKQESLDQKIKSQEEIAKQAHKDAQDFYNRIEKEELGIDQTSNDFLILQGGKSTPSMFKERTLPKEVDEILREYLVQDIRDLVAASVNQITNTVSFDKRFGGDNLSLLQDKLVEEGASNAEAITAINHIRDNKLDHNTKNAKQALAEYLDKQEFADADKIVQEMHSLWNQGIDNRWKLLKNDMNREGLSVEEIEEVVRVIKQNTNMRRREVNRHLRDTMEGIKAYTYFAHLPRTVITQVGEFAVTGIQTGNVLRSLQSMWGRLAAINNIARKGAGFNGTERQEMLNDFAQLHGIVNERAASLLMQSRLNLNMGSKRIKLMVERFMAKTGQTHVTNADKLAATDCARLYINRLAERVAKDSRLKKSSEFFLRDLGIPQEKMKEFIDYVQKANEAYKNNDLSLYFGEKGEMGELYTTALNRFVDSSIINPNPAMRHRIGNDPILSLIYGFMSYTMGFSKNVLIKSYRQMKKGVNPKEDFSIGDRLMLVSSFGSLPVMLAMGWLVNELKDLFFGLDREKEDSEKFMEALSMSGLTGGLDYIANIMRSMKYNRSLVEAAAGPALSDLNNFVDAHVKYFANNSMNTNTAERNLAKQYYNLAILPIINAYVPTFIPGFTIPAVTVQAASSPKTKAAFVDTVAGDPYRNYPSKKPKTIKEKVEAKKKRMLKKIEDKNQ